MGRLLSVNKLTIFARLTKVTFRSTGIFASQGRLLLDWPTVSSRKMALIEFGLSLFQDGFVALRSPSVMMYPRDLSSRPPGTE